MAVSKISLEENSMEDEIALSSNDKSEDDQSSEKDPENEMVDNLYILKESLIKNNKLDGKARTYLNQILNIIVEYPNLSLKLYKWRFIEKELVYCLRSKLFGMSLKILKLIIQEAKEVPEFCLTKKFLFFMTECLYFSLGGMKGLISKTNDVPAKQIDAKYTKDIVEFFKIIVDLAPRTLQILLELGLFDICNNFVCMESLRLFATVFTDVYYSGNTPSQPQKSIWTQDGVYEIHRKFFSPEIIFREKLIFNIKNFDFNHKNGIYEEIYNQFTNIRQFADLNVKEAINFLLYKKMCFINEDLELEILSESNKVILEKFVRFYRRSLDVGQKPDDGFAKVFYKLLDDVKLSREAALALYHYKDLDFKMFNELRIRNIFRLLEYSCELDCGCINCNIELKIDAYERKHVSKKVEDSDMEELKMLLEEKSSNIIDNSYVSTNIIFGQEEDDSKFSIPCSLDKIDKRNYKSGEDIAYEDKVGLDCERQRLLQLLEVLYQNVKKEYFYKPSFLILLRANMDHCPGENGFVIRFFSDYFKFLNENDKNIAGCLFPDRIKGSKPIKMVEYKVLDEDQEINDLLKVLDEEVNDEVIESDEEIGFKRRKNL